MALEHMIDIKRSKQEIVLNAAITALLLGIFAALGITFALNFPAPLRKNPVVYNQIILPEQQSYCPGEELVFELQITITEPAIIGVNEAVIYADSGDFVPGTLYTDQAKPFVEPIPLDLQTSYIIPDLEPGEYKRITAMSSSTSDANPVFVVVPFSVRDDCD